MGKFRKAAPGGRKGGTGKKSGGAKSSGRKPSRGVGRGKGQSNTFIPDRAKPTIGRGTKRKKAVSKSDRIESNEKPLRSRERRITGEEGTKTGMYQRREAGGRPDTRAFDDKTPRKREQEATQRNSRPFAKPFASRDDSDKPVKRSYSKDPKFSKD